MITNISGMNSVNSDVFFSDHDPRDCRHNFE